MIVLGVTGSSGSGKTTFCKILSEKYKIKIIDADKVVKEMSVPGTEYLNSIKENLGEENFLEDGNLNRKVLAQKIYTDKNALETLNKLTFKYVVDEIKKRLKSINEDVVVIDAPLLIESGIDSECDEIISLIADKEIKIDRICKRDNLSRDIAIKRLAIQQTDEFYKLKSNFIIENNCDAELEGKVDEFIKNIIK